MNEKKGTFKGLTGNQLKIIALIAMTCDHVGKELLPQYGWLQIIGRLTFPIFAYMIAEGCRYTKNKKRYLITIAVLAIVCQVVYYIAMGSLYQCVLVTFSLSIGMIYLMERAMIKRTESAWTMVGVGYVVIYLVSVVIPRVLPDTDFAIDYGMWGILLPIFAYIGKNKEQRLFLMAIGLLLLANTMGGIQWYSLAAVPLLALYNGERGRMKMKYLFYVYYPLHLVVIYAIGLTM